MTPDPKTFPAPHMVATYIPHRTAKFKTHKTLGLAKGAITGKSDHQRRLRCDAWVYTWDEDLGWVELHHLLKGSIVDDHPFYKTPASARRGPIKGPSDKAVAQAIESIMRVHGGDT